LLGFGVDMAHMGARYGDQFEAIAHNDEMVAVAERDQGRMERIAAGDAPGFWELVRENRDDSSGAALRRFTRS